MHSSRMRTARSLTTSHSICWGCVCPGGGVCVPRGCACPGGGGCVCLGGNVCPGGVYAGGMPGGHACPVGVCARGVHAQGGICATHTQTAVKTLPCGIFVAGFNNAVFVRYDIRPLNPFCKKIALRATATIFSLLTFTAEQAA